MIYLPGLVLALAVLWFALSGQTSPFFIGLGVVSVLLTLWLAGRLRIIDRNASPYYRLPQMLVYLGWLIVEVVKANIAVIAREVLKGLAAGETYVSEGSFLIKADIGKSGASHDH